MLKTAFLRERKRSISRACLARSVRQAHPWARVKKELRKNGKLNKAEIPTHARKEMFAGRVARGRKLCKAGLRGFAALHRVRRILGETISDTRTEALRESARKLPRIFGGLSA